MEKTNPKSTPEKLKTANLILIIGIGLILVALYILLKTLFPVLKHEIKYAITLSSTETNELTPPNTDFSLVIPKLNTTANIVKNVNPYDPSIYQKALTQGIAHAAGSGLPGDNKNIFIFSHSSANFFEASKFNSVFYLLNKLEPGDEITIYYEGSPHTYHVTTKQIVNAGDVQYLKPGDSEQLTLMTCWPPGTTYKRLLIQAK